MMVRRGWQSSCEHPPHLGILVCELRFHWKIKSSSSYDEESFYANENVVRYLVIKKERRAERPRFSSARHFCECLPALWAALVLSAVDRVRLDRNFIPLPWVLSPRAKRDERSGECFTSQTSTSPPTLNTTADGEGTLYPPLHARHQRQSSADFDLKVPSNTEEHG
jgi:hypothetical protein